MDFLCLDLEGVLVPEIWIHVAEATGVDALRATTRDVPDYDELMTQRLDILKNHGIGIADFQSVIKGMAPMPGAVDFLDWAREQFQVVILSDTYYEFAAPLMRQLGWPTLMCHRLSIDADGSISNYHLRQQDPKRQAVLALKGLNYRTYAAGDSYNDISMLQTADAGTLFRAPDSVCQAYPEFPSVSTYEALQERLLQLKTSR